MPRDPKITPITRHDPRTFYATRITRAKSGEVWDLWSGEDGRRIGFLSIIDDGNIVYGLAAVKKGTQHEEVTDLLEGLYGPSSTDAHGFELTISEYETEPVPMQTEFDDAE